MKKRSLKLTPLQIIKRGNYIYHLYYWIYALFYDFKICGRTLNGTLFYDADGAYPVQSISYIYLKELIKEIDYTDKDVFVDVGCAWGRLIGYLNFKTQIREFVGVELNSEVASFTYAVFQKKDNIKIIDGDILNNIPENGTIFYLFNPFDGKVLSRFLDEFESKIHHDAKIYYLYPTCKDEFDNRKQWSLTSTRYLSPKHMGQLELRVYDYKS